MKSRFPFSYSLRSLFLFVTAAAALCAWVVAENNAYRRQRVAVQQMIPTDQAIRSRAYVDWKPDQPWLISWLFPGETTFEIDEILFSKDTELERIELLKDVRHVRRISFSYSDADDQQIKTLVDSRVTVDTLDLRGVRSISDKAIRQVCELSSLIELHLSRTPLTNEGLKTIGRLQNLQCLSIGRTNIDDEGIRSLRTLNNLRTLELIGTHVTSKAMEVVGQLQQLESLDLSETNICGPSFAELSKLKKLHRLDLDSVEIDDRCASVIGSCESLEILDLNRAHISERGISQICQLSKLQLLWLQRNELSEMSISDLGRLKSLTRLLLHKTKMPPNGLERLRSLLPGCSIDD